MENTGGSHGDLIPYLSSFYMLPALVLGLVLDQKILLIVFAVEQTIEGRFVTFGFGKL